MKRALVFGGSGALGSAIVNELRAVGWSVDVASRSALGGATIDLSSSTWAADAAACGSYEGIVWAQGVNHAGGALEAEPADLHSVYDTNVVFIVESLKAITEAGGLAPIARGVVLSSVWQVTARANKVAYVSSKAALSGLVPAIAADMASKSFAINGVLPGVIDTPMTRSQLSEMQLQHVESESLGGVLASPQNVANAVAWLIDPRAAGINAQWVAVDNGWSAVRSV
ncbi:MAG: SDR family oxidoreductase [Candidatus Saccharibacteria bacterium]|nr:SDR family oxidoreductase [Microbacteriaceae bacterium]